MSKLKIWILASRPKTLLAAFVPVLVGSAFAFNENAFIPEAAFIALLCAVLIQIGTNFVNDLYDFLSGADNKDRVGPVRVVSAGYVKPGTMKAAIIICFTLTFLFGLYLVYLSGWIILVIGAVSILAGIAYTAGPYPLAYNGLGDIFVFIFFGLVGTIGTYYVQTQSVNVYVILASIPVGVLITNILVINNYRDIETDRESGKFTLAVKLGKKFTRVQYSFSLFVSYAIPILLFFFYKESFLVFLPLLTIPIALKLIRMIKNFSGQELNKALELTAKFAALFGVLLSAGIAV